MKRWIRTLITSLVLAGAVSLVPCDVKALSLQEILVMSGQGLSEDVLITVINSSNDIPRLGPEDYEALTGAGLTTKTVDAIAARRKALDEQSAAQESDQADAAGDKADAGTEVETTPNDVAENAPETEQEPAQETAPETSAENAQTEPDEDSSESTQPQAVDAAPAETAALETDVSLVPIQAVGDDTVLAPIESSNVPIVFRKFFEEAYETYSVQAEVARRYARLRDETASERAYDSEVPKVLGYIRQISENAVGSLESCLALEETIHPSMDTPLGAALNECIGLALYTLNAPGMASVYLDQALQSKAKLKDFSSMLETFLKAAHEADYTSTDPMRILAHFKEQALSGQAELLYFEGYSLVYGPQPDEKLAIQLLSNIPKGTIYYAKAQVMLATLAVRAPGYRFKSAAEHLNSALEALKDDESKEAYEIRNTVWLALGRIAYENKAFDAADAFYRRVDVNSHHLKESILENAWGQLFAKHPSQVLSLTHSLRAPMFEKSWMPDLLLLEAGAWLGLCRYSQAQKALEALRSETISEANALKEYMAQTPSRDYYNQLMRHAEDPVNSRHPGTIYRRVISDLTFKSVHHSIRVLSSERRALSEHTGAGFGSLPKLQKVYDEAIAQRQQYMSTVISGIYEDALTELHNLDISSSQIAIEIRLAERRREAECLKITAAGGKCSMAEETAGTTGLSKRENEAYWTFDGEFWRDEIRSYVSGVSSMCGE